MRSQGTDFLPRGWPRFASRVSPWRTMDVLSMLGTAVGLGTLSGLNLYLTTLLTGSAIHFNLLHVAEKYESLAVLGNPWVMGVAAALYLVEFSADKIPWLDSIWDGVHTVIRPAGACVLAFKTMGDVSPSLEVIGALAAGGFSLTTHTAKAATRLVANTSPEPVSNILLSLGEDAAVTGGIVLMFLFPTLALITCTVLVVGLWIVLPKLFRKLGGFMSVIKAKLSRTPKAA